MLIKITYVFYYRYAKVGMLQIDGAHSNSLTDGCMSDT